MTRELHTQTSLRCSGVAARALPVPHTRPHGAAQVSSDATHEGHEWQLLATLPFTLGFKMATSMYLLYRPGLGDAHRRQTVENLGAASGWAKLAQVQP